VQARAAADAGHPVEIEGPTEVQAGGYGHGTFRTVLAEAPPGWSASVVARVHVGDDPAAGVDAEVAWQEFVGGAGIGVVPVLATDRDSGVVVTGPGPAMSLLECIADRPTDVQPLLALLGETQARLHEVSTEGAPVTPLADAALDAELEMIGASGKLGREADWLAANRPAAAVESVVVHGDFQPAHLRLDSADAAGRDEPVVTNWVDAALRPAEWDVALTVLTLWSAPYLAPGRTQRMMLKMARDFLIDTYFGAYTGARSVDEDMLRWYEALQAARFSARLAAGAVRDDPWDVVGLVPTRSDYGKDLGKRFWDLAG
jgi:aminoglycoside/choline kinase family phosphotransferase